MKFSALPAIAIAFWYKIYDSAFYSRQLKFYALPAIAIASWYKIFVILIKPNDREWNVVQMMACSKYAKYAENYQSEVRIRHRQALLIYVSAKRSVRGRGIIRNRSRLALMQPR